MKSLLKFALLSALIISGKLYKPSNPTTIVQNVEATTVPDSSVVLVHQLLTAEPAKPTQVPVQTQQSGSRLLAEMF